jgi:very-short-patch-repair endonuclease
VAGASVAQHHLALARLVALREQLTLPYVLSHESAALLWGLPVLMQPTRTHVIQRSRPTSRGAPDVIRHVTDVPEDQRTVHRGHPVTTLERTVVDCAMTLGAHGGLVVADAALHGGAESPGETSARFVLLRAGLPAPETQVAVSTRLGTFWADLGWREWRLLAEYDGRLKYGAAGMASEVVVQEKRRQEAIEEAGWRVLRLTKEDLHEPSQLIQRLARYLPPGSLEGLRPRSALNRVAAQSGRRSIGDHPESSLRRQVVTSK